MQLAVRADRVKRLEEEVLDQELAGGFDTILFDGGGTRGPMIDREAKALNEPRVLVLGERSQKGIFRREIRVEGASREACRLADMLEGGCLHPLFDDDVTGRRDEPLLLKK